MYRSHASEMLRLKRKNTDLMNDRDKLRRLLDDKDNKIVRLRDEIIKIASVLEEVVPKEGFERQADKMIEESEEVSIFKRHLTELEKIRAMFENLKKQLEEVTHEKDDLIQSQEIKNGEVACLKANMNKLEKDLQEKKTEIEVLQNQNKYLRSGISSLEKKLTRSNITIENLRQKMNEKSPTAIQKELIVEEENPTDELEMMKHEQCRVAQEKNYLLNSLKERNDQIIQNEEALQKVNLELEKTRSRVHALEQEMKDVANMLSKQKETRGLEISTGKPDHSGIEVGKVKSLLNKAMLEKDELIDAIEKKDKQIKDLKLKVRLIMRELRFEKDKILVETEPLKAEIERLNKRLEKLMQEKDSLNQLIEERDKHIDDLKHKIRQITHEVSLERNRIPIETEELEKEIQQSKQERELSRTKSNKLLEKLVQEKDELTRLVEDRDRHIEDLKLKLRQISQEVTLERNRIPIETGPLEKEIQQSKQELELSRIESNKLLEKLMQEKDELTKSIADKDKHIEFLKSRLRKLSDEIDLETDKAIIETGLSNASMQHLRQKLVKLDLETESLHQVIEEKNAQLNALTDDYSRLLQENKQYIKIIEELEKKLNQGIDKAAITTLTKEEPKWNAMGGGKDNAPPQQRF